MDERDVSGTGGGSSGSGKPTVVLAHPSPDLYGSDRMLLESIRALIGGYRVVVTLPQDGPLCPLLREEGAEVVILPVPVLRKATLRRPLRLLAETLRALRPAIAFLRRERPALLYVNTVTIPVWLLAGRLAGIPMLGHVHEAEERVPGPFRLLLYLPMRPARVVVANSRATAEAIGAAVPRRRVCIILNGIEGPPEPIPPVSAEPPAEPHLVLVGRLSENKGSDVAIEAVRLLRAEGHKVRLTLVGSIYPGYEWYEARLRELAAQPGAEVEFAGFQPGPWRALAEADIALMPSRREPFGLVAVEAMMAGRPLVASAAQGLKEVVADGRTGVLVTPGDPAALADGVRRLLADWPAAVAMAERARQEANRRFAKDRYYRDLRQTVDGLASVAASSSTGPRPNGDQKQR